MSLKMLVGRVDEEDNGRGEMYGKPTLIATSRILDPMGSAEREGGQGGTSAWNWHRESDTVTSIRRSTEDAGTRLQGAMEGFRVRLWFHLWLIGPPLSLEYGSIQ
ncbi:unnamed protein product [Eretmochelys imbricata]